ncbi:MAG: ATP-binding protein, partial [Mucilaginibacter sp.]
QLENLTHKEGLDEATRLNVLSIFQDTFQLSEIISSLVALADINSRERHFSFIKLRLDEMVFSTTAELAMLYPDFKLKFEVKNSTKKETDLEIFGDETLLKIALLNLFKNAYNYSDNHMPECTILQTDQHLELLITNTGNIPDVKDTATLFTPFYRGSNTGHIPGTGVGLSIVKRVLDYHKATVSYRIINQNTNRISVLFSL